MKRKLFFLILILILPFFGNVYAAVDIDADQNGATDIEFGGTNGKTEEEALENLGISSILSSKQAASDNLSLYSGVTPSTPFLNLAVQPSYADMAALLGSGLVSQSATIEHMGTLTPLTGDRTNIRVISESDPCTVIVAKNGTESTWDEVFIFNYGSTDLVFESNPGTILLPGTLTLSPGGSLKLMFIVSQYYFMGGDTDAYFSGANLAPHGKISGARNVLVASGNITLAANQMGTDLLITGTGTATIPPDLAIDLGGVNQRFIRMTTAPYYVQLANTTDEQMVLKNGTTLSVNHLASLGSTMGELFELVNFQNNKYHFIQGVATDGGEVSGAGTYLTDASVIAAYYFEENGEDATSENNDLTVVGATYEGTTPAPKQGSYSAEGVHASAQYFSSTDADFNQLQTGAFSVSAWVYYAGDSGYVIFGKGTTTGNLALTLSRYATDNNLELLISANGTTVIERRTASDSMPYGEWVYVTLTYDEAVFRIYLNGIEHRGGNFIYDEKGGYAYSSGIYDSTEPFMIMRGATYPGNIQNFTGNIDEFYITGRKLLDAEVIDMKNNGLE